MDDAKQAWRAAGDRFTSLGRRLAEHYRAQAKEGEEPAETQRKLEEVAREIGRQLERAVGALDDTIKDTDARSDLKGAIAAIGDAIAATVHEVGDAVRRGRSDERPPRPDPDGEDGPEG
jgi:hypothetical protein